MASDEGTVLVAGASGLAGSAITAAFAEAGRDVVAVSRRRPWRLPKGVRHFALDLTDRTATADALAQLGDVEHVIYAALNENEADVVTGWDDPAQRNRNVVMFRNLLDAVGAAGMSLRHVVAIHGTKAYGSHQPGAQARLPFRESDPGNHDSTFYAAHLQYLMSHSRDAGWNWTIFRPGAILGVAVGANLNWSLGLGVFAALHAEAKRPLPAPVGTNALVEVTNADLIAQACLWATESEMARDEIFNVMNGDLFAMREMFPLLAESFDIALEEPSPFDLARRFDELAPLWPAIVARHGLSSPPDLSVLLGAARQVIGGWSANLPPGNVLPAGFSSTIKLREAGFSACADTEISIRRTLGRYRELRILP